MVTADVPDTDVMHGTSRTPNITPSFLLRRQRQRLSLQCPVSVRPTAASTPTLAVCWSGKPGKRAAFSSRVFNILPTYCSL
ncbi:hypothetical protein SRHO_G00121870 [Serrasalmus rhombeus]